MEAGDVFTFADLWFLIGVLDRSISKIQKATFVADLWCVTVACGQDRFNVNADQLDSFLQQLQAGHTGYLDQPLFKFSNSWKLNASQNHHGFMGCCTCILPVCSRWWSIFPPCWNYFKKNSGFSMGFPQMMIWSSVSWCHPCPSMSVLDNWRNIDAQALNDLGLNTVAVEGLLGSAALSSFGLATSGGKRWLGGRVWLHWKWLGWIFSNHGKNTGL